MYAPTASGMNGPVELGPVGQVEDHQHQPEGDDGLEPGRLPRLAGLGIVAARLPALPENPAAQQGPGVRGGELGFHCAISAAT